MPTSSTSLSQSMIHDWSTYNRLPASFTTLHDEAKATLCSLLRFYLPCQFTKRCPSSTLSHFRSGTHTHCVSHITHQGELQKIATLPRNVRRNYAQIRCQARSPTNRLSKRFELALRISTCGECPMSISNGFHQLFKPAAAFIAV